jgi:hypothetical protein
MTISSRTPEGQPNRCPVCDNVLRLEPSRPSGDAPCPFCGSLLWFPQPLCNRPLRPQDRIRVKQGTFAALEGTVEAVLGPRPGDDVLGPRALVRVTIRIFGRPVPVELEARQVELVAS